MPIIQVPSVDVTPDLSTFSLDTTSSFYTINNSYKGKAEIWTESLLSKHIYFMEAVPE